MGTEGSGDGQFNTPEGLAVDSLGNVYVTDTFNYRIQKFDTSGNFITKWRSPGSGDSQFDHPRRITVDEFGKVYVPDPTTLSSHNGRVQIFAPDGAFLGKIEGSVSNSFRGLGIAMASNCTLPLDSPRGVSGAWQEYIVRYVQT